MVLNVYIYRWDWHTPSRSHIFVDGWMCNKTRLPSVPWRRHIHLRTQKKPIGQSVDLSWRSQCSGSENQIICLLQWRHLMQDDINWYQFLFFNKTAKNYFFSFKKKNLSYSHLSHEELKSVVFSKWSIGSKVMGKILF
jgi:hypothetical protein